MRRRWIRLGCTAGLFMAVALVLASCGTSGENLRGDGFWEVGIDFRRPPSAASGLPPDRYVFDFEWTEESPECYWAVRDRAGRTIDSDLHMWSQRVRILVPGDTHELELRGCGNVNLGGLDGPAAVPYVAGQALEDGIWRAGEDFPHPPAVGGPDRYVFEDGGTCRWATIDEGGRTLDSDDFFVSSEDVLSSEDGPLGESLSRLTEAARQMGAIAFRLQGLEQAGLGETEGPRRARILVRRGTFELELSGCNTIYTGDLEGPDAVGYMSRAGQPLGNGVWRVGVDLPAVAPETYHRYALNLPRQEETYDCDWKTYDVGGWFQGGDRRRVRSSERRPESANARAHLLVRDTTYELELSGCGEQDFSSPEVVPAE